jgi:hypothetical protein
MAQPDIRELSLPPVHVTKQKAALCAAFCV